MNPYGDIDASIYNFDFIEVVRDNEMPRRVEFDAKTSVKEALSIRGPLGWSALRKYSDLSEGGLSYALNELIGLGEIDVIIMGNKKRYELSRKGQKNKSIIYLTNILKEYHCLFNADRIHPKYGHTNLYSNLNLRSLFNYDIGAHKKSLEIIEEINDLFYDLEGYIKTAYFSHFEKHNYSNEQIKKIMFYDEHKKYYLLLKARHDRSGVVKSLEEDENIKEEEVMLFRERGWLKHFKSIDEIRDNQVFKGMGNISSIIKEYYRLTVNLPLTMEMYEKYMELKLKMESISDLWYGYDGALEKAVNSLCLISYNWDFEDEMANRIPYLTKAGLDKNVEAIDVLIDTLTRDQLEEYRRSVEVFLEGRLPEGYLLPEWPGEDDYRPVPPGKGDWMAWGEKILRRINRRLTS